MVEEGEVTPYQEAVVGITGGRTGQGVDHIQECNNTSRCVSSCAVLWGVGCCRVDTKSVGGGDFYISSKKIEQTLRICSKVCDRVMTTYYGLCTIYIAQGGAQVMHLV